ncbi:MAG: FHA domain-containing protein [Actinobacteria bacterium]|nr:FHA domain-containing protein [Actinomycetota bacterium]MBU1493386.1 FHA domain-containing protein [Actinomycetota bacterium]
MGLARGLERRLEGLVDGLASRLFKGRIHPVELGTRIVRAADLAVFDTPAGPGAPNAFRVVMGGDSEPPHAVAAAERALEEVLGEAAAEQGWRLEGPPTVRISFGPGPPAAVSVEAGIEAGVIEPFATLEGPDGQLLPIGMNRVVIGRSKSADVRIPGGDVSRRHALLWREAGSLWLADLGSSNGTFVNGTRLAETVSLEDGDHIFLGGTALVFRRL